MSRDYYFRVDEFAAAAAVTVLTANPRTVHLAARLANAMAAPAQPYGVSPSLEAFVPLRNGSFFVFPSAQANVKGADYVRVVNDKGGEVVYWSFTEWQEDPVWVMGAICGAMLAGKQPVRGEPEFYQFAADCVFPEGVKFTPYAEIVCSKCSHIIPPDETSKGMTVGSPETARQLGVAVGDYVCGDCVSD